MLLELICLYMLECPKPVLITPPPPPHNILRRNEYAYTRLYGTKVLCSQAFREPCGLRLKDCTSGTGYECAIDVEIVPFDELEKRARALRAQAEAAGI